MPLSGSFTDEAGGFASFLHQVQKSYVPERDVDGRKFDKAMSRLRAPLRMSSSFGPKNERRGRVGRVAMSRNGSVQLRWLKQ